MLVGQPLFRSGNIEGHLATQRYGKLWFDRVPLLGDVPGRWKEVALVTGVRRESTSLPGAKRLVAGAKSADARDAPWKQVRSSDGWVAMLTRVGEQRNLLQKPDVILSARDLHSGTEVTCSSPLCTGKQITGIQWRPDHGEVLFTVTDPEEGGAQSIYR